MLAPQDTPIYRSRAERFDDLVLQAVAQLEPRWAAEYPGLTRRTRLPVKDVADLSSRRDGYLLACIPEPDADPDELRQQLTEIEGVSTRIPAALPRPLAKMIRGWARSWPGEDLPASLTDFGTRSRPAGHTTEGEADLPQDAIKDGSHHPA